ncbi:TPA: hypothetical protein N1429_002052 [Salmonella enterica subsp. enterica serovar Minnesota]|nr:hypothetical protein [Salmonella enterica subsp. enterica serovar Minnesota]
MSTITKEWLQQKIAEIEATRDDIPFGLDEDDSNTLAALRIAQASLEAEPVAWRYRYVHTPKTEEHGSPFTTEWKLCDSEDECNPSDCFERQPLYTAPPAPVSVPDAISTRQAIAKMESHEPCDSINVAYKFGWNACRAAMLQAGNSPVIGIDLASEPDRSVEVRYFAPPGYVMVPKEPTEAMMLHKSGCKDHPWDDPECVMRQTRRLVWAHMLEAVAQQEVKSSLEHGMQRYAGAMQKLSEGDK